jgi:hypothetical protein
VVRRRVGERIAQPASFSFVRVPSSVHRCVLHALVRLDGPRTVDGFAAAPAVIGTDLLAGLVRDTPMSVRLTVAGCGRRRPSASARVRATHVDTRRVRTSRRTDDPARTLSPGTGRGLFGQPRHQVRRRHRVQPGDGNASPEGERGPRRDSPIRRGRARVLLSRQAPGTRDWLTSCWSPPGRNAVVGAARSEGVSLRAGADASAPCQSGGPVLFTGRPSTQAAGSTICGTLLRVYGSPAGSTP